jgi:collagenase-like PrtC family protease
MTHRMRLALGPVGYYWPRERLLQFYEEVAEWPVEVVYLGETICAKRRAMDLEDWLEVARWLRTTGKEVVLSTLALIEAESELRTLRRQCAQDELMVEANDMAAVQLLAGRAPFVTGPSVNVYNQRTLALLARLGLYRWVMPVELSGQTLADMQAQRPPGVQTEVCAYGRLPLAYSARCFTARARGKAKDDCGLSCLEDPEGLLVRTQDGQDFLVLNGIQTQSAQTQTLFDVLPELGALGVDVLRIGPQAEHTAEVVASFRACLEGTVAPQEATARLASWMPTGGACNGYWHGEEGLRYHHSAN